MFDSQGIIGQKESDGSFGGGDSCSWHGAYTALGGDSRNFYDLFGVGFGGLRRHPTEGYSAYYKHFWDGRITRDQKSGALFAIIMQKDKRALLKVFIHHAAWLWLFSYSTRPNGKLGKWKLPDVTGPEIWQMYIRGFGGKYAMALYPVLLCCDLLLLFGSLFLKWQNNSHVISHLNRLIVATEIAPTFISKYALKFLNYEFLEDNLRRYWCGFRGNCFMKDLYLDRIFK